MCVGQRTSRRAFAKQYGKLWPRRAPVERALDVTSKLNTPLNFCFDHQMLL
jgi:hypothetical protein